MHSFQALIELRSRLRSATTLERQEALQLSDTVLFEMLEYMG